MIVEELAQDIAMPAIIRMFVAFGSLLLSVFHWFYYYKLRSQTPSFEVRNLSCRLMALFASLTMLFLTENYAGYLMLTHAYPHEWTPFYFANSFAMAAFIGSGLWLYLYYRERH
jgi:hypothetical protein